MASVAADRGSATVELALVLPVLLLILFAVAEVTAVARIQLELSHAAREGARVAATAPDPDAAIRRVREVMDEEGSKVRITVERAAVVGSLATVEVYLPFSLPVIGLEVPLTARAVMRVER